MFWGVIIGITLGYFFKPQIDRLITRAIKAVRERRSHSDRFHDRY